MTSTGVIETPTDAESEPAQGRPAWMTPGWACVAVIGLVTAPILHYYNVSAHDMIAFALYAVLAIALPGALIWRGLLGRASHISTDLAAGTAVGSAIEVGFYVLCRAAGAPIAVIAWPLLTYAIFAAVPGLRRHWRGSGERLPIGMAVTYLALGLYVVIFSAWTTFRIEALSGRAAASPYVDIPFHLALSGELKNHFPAQIPYVANQPLNYHWYVYAHIASASWVTGIDPEILIPRLLALPALAAFGVLMVGIGRALTRRWWPGIVAIVLSNFAAIMSPYRWNGTMGALTPLDYAWFSPTEAFAAVIFAGLVLALIGVLRGTYERRVGPIILLVLLAGGVAGAKATYLPLLTCGALLVLLTQMILTRRPGKVLIVLGIIAVWLAFAQFVLFGGGTEGMIVAPLITTKRSDIGLAVLGWETPANPWLKMFVLFVLILIAWGLAWLGMAGLAIRELREDPGVRLVFGIGIAGLAAVFLLGHPNLSQYYFYVTSAPYIALAAAIGLAGLMDRFSGSPRVRAGLLVTSAALGVVAIYVVQATVGRRPPGSNPLRQPLPGVVLPFAVLLAILAILGISIWIFARRSALGRRTAVAAIAIMAIATTAPHAVGMARIVSSFATTDARKNVIANAPGQPYGAIAAMHWLRAHSRPDDIVATNEQCRREMTKVCDARDFWVSGYSERRVLVEGWAYTEKALMNATPYKNVYGGPYWDPALRDANNEVFYAPTAANVAALKAEHGVRWLVAVHDTVDGGSVSPDLGSFATLRFEASGVAVYEIN